MENLKYYGGNGVESAEENGRFEIKIADETVQYNRLSQAIEHYNKLNCSKSLWDITGVPELLECHLTH